MKLYSALATVWLIFASAGLQGQDLEQVRKLEASGDAAGARALLARAAQSSPRNVAALTAYAEFLQRYGDPGAKDAYNKVLAALKQSGDNTRTAVITKRLSLLELTATDTPAPAEAPRDNMATVPIPGPIRSFARMVAIAHDASPNDILQALARNEEDADYSGNESLVRLVTGIHVRNHGGETRITGTIPATLSDFKIDPPSLLTLPVKNETPVRVDMTWRPQ